MEVGSDSLLSYPHPFSNAARLRLLPFGESEGVGKLATA